MVDSPTRRGRRGAPTDAAQPKSHLELTLTYTMKRLAMVPLGVLVAAVIGFGLVNLMPGNPAIAIAGPTASQDEIDRVATQLGLDEPVLNRLGDFVRSAAQLDLGTSYFTGREIWPEMRQRLPASLELIAVALSVAAIIGLAVSSVAALAPRRAVRRLGEFATTLLQSIPDFMSSLLLIFVLFYIAGWAPAPVGRLSLGQPVPDTVSGFLVIDSLVASDFATAGDALAHLALPALALGGYYAAFIGRIAIPLMATATRSPQVQFARACGLRRGSIYLDILRMIRTPLLTYFGIILAALIGGAAVVETVFSWGGIGQWAIGRILSLDVPAIQGFIVVAAVGTLVIFLVTDLLAGLLDPRIKYGG